MIVIKGKQLTTFEVAPDGESVSIHVMDEQACPATLVLPTDCLNALMMTLPEMVRRCLQLRFRDPSMRVVYPVGSWELEQSPVSGVVMTLRTPDGFAVSFSLPALELLRMCSQGASADIQANGIISN
jgi:hypothetical protein